MIAIQYDLFTDKTPLNADEAYLMRIKVQELEEMVYKSNRGMFARLGEQNKCINRLSLEMEAIKSSKGISAPSG